MASHRATGRGTLATIVVVAAIALTMRSGWLGGNAGKNQVSTSALPSPEPAKKDAVATALLKAAEDEIDRVKQIDPAKTVIKPPAILCKAVDGLRDIILAQMQDETSRVTDTPGCFPVIKGTRVDVLNFPNALTAHVLMILPEHKATPSLSAPFYMLPASIADIADVPADKLLVTPTQPQRKKRL